MSATMKDIARLAGVSIVTVSRALNNKEDIHTETKKRILRIARELNYTGNDLAKSLVTQKTGIIGVLVINTADTFYASIIQGINDRCFGQGYSMMLCSTNENADKELEYINLMRKKQVEGLLLYPLQQDFRYLDTLSNIGLPFVLMNRHAETLDSHYVTNDNVAGTYAATRYLIQQGHHKIMYICAKPEASSGKERIAGCQKAVEEAGLSSDALIIRYCEETIDGCYRLVQGEIEKELEATAVFVWDDRMALGAMKAIYETGLRIPEDIAVVGYDDIETAEYFIPPLTTVRQPTFQIGEIAADILLEHLTSDIYEDTQHVVLKPELVIRESA